MIGKIKTFWTSLDEMTTVSRRELFLEIAVCTLAGILLGIIFTPKKAVTIGSNNGSHNTGKNSGSENSESDAEEV